MSGCHYYSLRVLRLLPCALCQSISTGGFIPYAVGTSGNFERVSTLLKQSYASFLFASLSNYRDLIAASLYVRILQTHLLHPSPSCSLEQRSM
jgi:hypothetical protein